jgi:hypothetical protein
MAALYKLHAIPSLISEGKYSGELRGVTFVATSTSDTLSWYTINCGHLQSAFEAITTRSLAEEMMEQLYHGEDIVFPGRYEPEQFRRGFHAMPEMRRCA